MSLALKEAKSEQTRVSPVLTTSTLSRVCCTKSLHLMIRFVSPRAMCLEYGGRHAQTIGILA